MDETELLLFLHIATAIAAFFLSGTLHMSEYQVRYAGTLQELRIVTRPFKYGVLFAPLLVLLVALGGRLGSLADYEMSEGWIWTSVVGSLLLFLAGPLVMARHGKELGAALAAAGEGAIPPAVRSLVCEPRPWMVGHANTGLALGIVLNMVVKPDTVGAVLVLLVGAGAGAWLGLWRSKVALAGVVPASPQRGRGCAGQARSTRVIASRSAGVTHSP